MLKKIKAEHKAAPFGWPLIIAVSLSGALAIAMMLLGIILHTETVRNWLIGHYDEFKTLHDAMDYLYTALSISILAMILLYWDYRSSIKKAGGK